MREGTTISTLTFTNGDPNYSPNVDVLAYGYAVLTIEVEGQSVRNWQGKTKTKRKLAIGDEVHITGLSDTDDWVNLRGMITFFLQT